jgi:hypothetical protein
VTVYLQEIQVVDLNNSSWDKEKSDPSKGEYEFTKKEYIDYNTKSRRPAWFFTWVRNNPSDGFKDIRDYQVKWKFSYVTPDDPYWPEGMSPDVQGHYTYGDVVLMKCPLVEELLRRKLAKDMSDGQAMSGVKGFQAKAENAGAGLSSKDQDYIDNMAGELLGK